MCEWCEKIEGGFEHSYYLSPFDTEVYGFEVCSECNSQIENNGIEGISMCGACCRDISDTNGYRINMRYDEHECDMICVKCLQDSWLENGMSNFKDADFFNYDDLEKAGYKQHDSYFCRSKESYDFVKNKFNSLKKDGKKVIVDIQASGMGFEHHIGIWTKEA